MAKDKLEVDCKEGKEGEDMVCELRENDNLIAEAKVDEEGMKLMVHDKEAFFRNLKEMGEISLRTNKRHNV